MSVLAVGQEASRSPWHGQHEIMLRTDAARWSSPENIVRDLRSSDKNTRKRALRDVGIDDLQIGVTIERIALTYVEGEGEPARALVSVLTPGAEMFAAVATPRNGFWQRVAAFNCWCKYDIDATAADPLSEFAHFDGKELVIRSSGGGTGIYSQEESRYRISDSTLREVITFISRHRECDPTSPGERCTLVRRWFRDEPLRDNSPGGRLYSSTAQFKGSSIAEPIWRVRDLIDNQPSQLTCHEYRWDEHRFSYVSVGSSHICK